MIYIFLSTKDIIYFEAGSPPKKITPTVISQVPYPLNIFDNQKIITNSGYGINISDKARLLSRFTSSQSAFV